MRPADLVLPLVLTGCAALDPPGFALTCEDGTAGRGVIGPNGLALTYSPGPAGTQAVVGLNRAHSGSGVRWQGVEIELWEQGGEAMLTAPGRAPTTCAVGP